MLKDIPPELVREIIVVDNGSRDATAAVAQAGGARVVHEKHRGYGSACLRGIAEVHSAEVIVFLDADHSDYPEELGLLLRPIFEGEADFVLGSRVLGIREPGALAPQAYWGNRLATFLMRLLAGFAYTDLGPFRAIRLSSLNALEMGDRDYGWTAEMQVKAARLGLRIREVPVSYRRRKGVSKISGTVGGTLRAGGKILYTLWKYGAWKPNPNITPCTMSLPAQPSRGDSSPFC